MKVIGVVGLPASGKGEFSLVASAMGIPVVVMGDVIRAAVFEAGLPPTDTNMGSVARRLRAEEGMDAIAKRTIPAIEACRSPVVVIDGIRSDAEVATFRRRFPDFVLVGIETAFETRVARLSARGRSDDLTCADDLRRRDERELSWGLGAALASADRTVTNNGDLAEFAAAVRQLIGDLAEEPCS
jgi:dephospho-CoA kinase